MKSFHIIPKAFGLSISNRNVKFAYLKKRGSLYELDTYGEHTFTQKDVMKRGVVASPEVLTSEIREALKLKEAHTLPAYAVISLPEEEVFLRIIQVPRMNDEDLKEAIKWETEANLPVSIDDVYHDYHIIPPRDPKKRLTHLDVLVTAIPRAVADGYMKAVEGAGIRPLVLEPESAALVRNLVSGEYVSSPILLLDIGYTRTRLVVFSGHNVRFTSFVPFSVSKLIQLLRLEGSGTSAKKAEQHLFREGLDVKTRAKNTTASVLKSELKDLSLQVKKYISFYNNNVEHEHGEGGGIKRVVLAGGGSLIPGIEDHLARDLGMPVSSGDPWTNILPKPRKVTPPMRYRDAIRFAPVLGLALRGSNLHTLP